MNQHNVMLLTKHSLGLSQRRAMVNELVKLPLTVKAVEENDNSETKTKREWAS